MRLVVFRSRARLAAALLVCASAAPATAQQIGRVMGPYKTADWAALAQLPDFNGVWEVGTVSPGPPGTLAARPAGTPAGGAAPGAPPAAAGAAPRRPPAPQPQLTAPYAAQLAAYRAAQARGDIQDDETANCVPPGTPGIMTQPYPIEFMLTPGKVTIVIEAYTQVRHIYTDGRTAPADPDLTWHGYSTGKWDNGVLVVDSVGFSPDTTLAAGVRHSDKMHVVERMRLAAPDVLEIQTTVTDPEALTAPFVTTRTYLRHRDWTTSEYICEQNNRNSVTDGKAGISLKN